MRRFPRALIPLLLAGCAATKAAEPPLALSPDAVVLSLPNNLNSAGNDVGFVAAEQFARIHGARLLPEATEMIRAELLDGQPVQVRAVVAALRGSGIEVGARRGTVDELQCEIDSGRPAVVLVIGDDSEEGEYLLLIGYDRTNELFVFLDGSGARHLVAVSRFLPLWHRSFELSIFESPGSSPESELLTLSGTSSPVSESAFGNLDDRGGIPWSRIGDEILGWCRDLALLVFYVPLLALSGWHN